MRQLRMRLLGGCWYGLGFIAVYVSLGENDIGLCGTVWYGRNIGVSLLRTGWEGQGRYKDGTDG